MISAGNLRLAVLEGRDGGADRTLVVRTDRYADDPSGAEKVNGHPGKLFVEEFRAFLSGLAWEGLEVGEPIGEDYGWGLRIGSPGRAPLWVAFSYMGPVQAGAPVEETVISVNAEAPLLPWKRLVSQPDLALRDRIQQQLKACCTDHAIPFHEETDA